MSERKLKKSIKEISPIDVYKLLPKTNCGECHEANCMTFATRVVNGELMIDDCPPITDKKYRVEYEKLARSHDAAGTHGHHSAPAGIWSK